MLNTMQASPQQIVRLKRSAKNNIKLISMDEGPEGPLYKVFGTTGTIYTINCSPNMNCTCIDYKKNKRYCKHIYFIFLNVYKTIPSLDKCYHVDELKELHTNFFNQTSVDVRDPLEPCSICFECIDTPTVCKVCKNGFHQSCINEMTKFTGKTNCPLCRSNLSESILEDLIKKVEML